MKPFYLLEPDDDLQVGDELLPKGWYNGPWVPVITDRDDKGKPIKCGNHIVRRRITGD